MKRISFLFLFLLVALFLSGCLSGAKPTQPAQPADNRFQYSCLNSDCPENLEKLFEAAVIAALANNGYSMEEAHKGPWQISVDNAWNGKKVAFCVAPLGSNPIFHSACTDTFVDTDGTMGLHAPKIQDKLTEIFKKQLEAKKQKQDSEKETK